MKEKDPEKFCEYCKKQFYRVRYPSKLQDLTNFKKRKFCSKLCMLEQSLQREKTRQWNGRKLQAFKKEKCATCKGIHWLGVHHRDGNWKNNDMNNLITLCASCHSKLHHHKGDYKHIYEKKSCTICELPVRAKGFCNRHYMNYRNKGDPLNKKGQ